jgi:hypothetical protein
MRRGSDNAPIKQIGGQELAQRYGAKWNQDTGKVERFLKKGQTLLFYKLPHSDTITPLVPGETVVDTITMGVYRRPLATELLVYNDPTKQTIPMPVNQHRALVYWILFRWYDVRDADIVPQAEKSQENFQRFEDYFGHKKSGRWESFAQDYPVGPILPVRIA